MKASTRLDQYLGEFGRRLKSLQLLRAAAALAGIALLVSVLGGMASVRSGFADGVVLAVRMCLLSLLAGTAWWLIVQPLRRLAAGIARDVESRAPSFGGRVETYQEMGAGGNPLRELLAEDTLVIADQHPPAAAIRQREMNLPGIVAALFAVVLLWLLVAGPGLLNYAARHIWAGWAFSGLLPPQSIQVSPGDEAIRRGGNLKVQAQLMGFDTDRVSLHVRIGAGLWQEVAMLPAAQAHEFTFFSVREPLQYYVTAAGIRSPEYQVEVVDLPAVKNLKLTYHYPDWTRRAPDTFEYGGDIRSIAGTGIELEVITDAPLAAGALVLNGASRDLDMDGATARTTFEILEDGEYYIAALIGREQVRLTDDYFITILEDGKPDIQLLRPGRDWRASNIEEVTARIDVKDDYDLESVELRYSVNGGDWQSVPFPVAERELQADHVFMLEQLGIAPADDPQAEAHLVPGDLVSYYAQASDRSSTSRTDMFFIEVQPFDRRFTQSQQAGGGGGGQGNEQQEISRRQKEIIVSTWNLIREAGEKTGAGQKAIEDNAALLSELQDTLAGQARTLAERARARQLSDSDDQISQFVEHLDQAAAAMDPASQRLAAVELEQAIQPEQEALQYLLRAEALFNDVSISRSRAGGGGGSQAGQDLAEMFELEMDLEKNQYETGSTASPESRSREQSDAMRRLEELARRQQELADNLARQRSLSEAQRWQQEMLRREVEELQQQLDSLQRGSAGDGTQTAQGGQAGERSELERRLDSAIRAMNEAAESMRGGDREGLQQAAAEAQRQLEGARDQVAREQRDAMSESFADMSGRAQELYRRQQEIEEQLQDAGRRILQERDRSGEVISGLTPDQEYRLAWQKQTMAEQVQQLQQDMQSATQEFRDSEPRAVREVEQATRELREAEVESRLAVASQYIRMGATPWIISSESAVTEALRGLDQRLRNASALAQGEGQQGGDSLDQALVRARGLRRELQQMTEGEPGQPSQEGGQQPGGQDGTTGGGYADQWRVGRGFAAPSPELRKNLERDLTDTTRAVWSAVPDLQRQGIEPELIEEIRRLAGQLDLAQFSRNRAIIDEEMNRVLSLLEQLELRLAQTRDTDNPEHVRSGVAEPIPSEYREAVAEYYRRLSRE